MTKWIFCFFKAKILHPAKSLLVDGFPAIFDTTNQPCMGWTSHIINHIIIKYQICWLYIPSNPQLTSPLHTSNILPTTNQHPTISPLNTRYVNYTYSYTQDVIHEISYKVLDEFPEILRQLSAPLGPESSKSMPVAKLVSPPNLRTKKTAGGWISIGISMPWKSKHHGIWWAYKSLVMRYQKISGWR